MNLDSLKHTWENQDEVSSMSIEINQPLLFSIKVNQQMKKMRNMIISRIAESVFFFIIIVSLWRYIVSDFSFSAPTISAMILNIFAIVGFAANIGQIVLISQLDYSAPVKALQKNIYNICSHKLQATRLVLLSVAFYMSYTFLGFDVLFGVDLYQSLSEQMVMFYSVSTAVLFIVTAWFLSRLNYKNITTPWVKWTMGYIIGEQLIEMAEFLQNAETA
ncbi:MAG: hypothetical protein P8I03_07530 [Thalassotalea sp.]|nr:hypothetical protein [Thalassotalea sp.]